MELKIDNNQAFIFQIEDKDNKKLKYIGVENKKFKDDLEFVDTLMDKILSETILYFYLDGINSCSEMVKRLTEENPMSYNNTYAYNYKMNEFLKALNLGVDKYETLDNAFYYRNSSDLNCEEIDGKKCIKLYLNVKYKK